MTTPETLMTPAHLRTAIRQGWHDDMLYAAADAWEEREKDHAVLLAEVLVLRNSDRDIREQLKASDQARQRAETALTRIRERTTDQWAQQVARDALAPDETKEPKHG